MDRPPLPPDDLEELCRSLRGLARALVLDDQSADDLVQEAWLAAFQSPPGRIRDVVGWLRVVTRNLARKNARRDARRRRRERLAASPEAVPPGSEQVDRAATAAWLRAAADELSPPYREVVRLRYLEQLPVQEIAARLDRAEGTVKSQLRRGLERMRDRLDRERGGRDAWTGAVVLAFGDARSTRTAPPPTRSPAPASEPSGRGHVRVLMAAALAVLVLVSLRLLQQAAPDEGHAAVEAARGSAAPHEPRSQAGVAATDSPSREIEPDPEETPGEASQPALEVRVVDAAGRAVSGATVVVEGSGRALRPGAARPLDGIGRFRIALPPEDWIGAPDFHPDAPGLLLRAIVPHRVHSAEYYVPMPTEGTRVVHLEVGGEALALNGRIVDAAGDPIEGALVRIERFEGAREARPDGTVVQPFVRAIQTDSDGRFGFTTLAREPFKLSVSAHGFLMHQAGEDPAGAAEHEVLVVLDRGGVISGRVTDTSGAPRAGVRVHVSVGGGADFYGESPFAVSGEDGRYSISGVYQAPWHVYAHDPAEPCWTARTAVDLSTSPAVRWDPVLDCSPGVRVRVLDEDGAPQAGRDVFLAATATDDHWRDRLATDDEGRAVFHQHPAGPATLSLFHDFRSGGLPSVVVEDVRPRQEEWVVEMPARAPRPASLSGTVLCATGVPPAKAHVSVGRVGTRSGVTVATDPGSGAFTVDGLPPGRYRLNVLDFSLGEWRLEDAVLADGEARDLGLVNLPEPGRLVLGWRWLKTFEGTPTSFVLADWTVTDAGTEVRRRLAGARPDRAEYALFPGNYLVCALAAGRVLDQRGVRIESGRTIRLESGPNAPFHLPIEVVPLAGDQEDVHVRVDRLELERLEEAGGSASAAAALADEEGETLVESSWSVGPDGRARGVVETDAGLLVVRAETVEGGASTAAVPVGPAHIVQRLVLDLTEAGPAK